MNPNDFNEIELEHIYWLCKRSAFHLSELQQALKIPLPSNGRKELATYESIVNKIDAHYKSIES